MGIRENALELVDKNTGKLQELCKWLHDHPEIGLQEFESCKKIAQFLRDEGFEVEENLAGMETAFKATKKNGKGPRIVYVAEYDALPGNGHACGHHMIATMSVGAAICLAKAALETMEGEITVIGTPSEETGHGKPYLVDHGVFEGFDAALIVHPNSATEMYTNMIAIGGVDYSFTGRPSHAGGAPYKGINALDAVVLFYNNLNALRQQLKDGTRVHGIILEAGSAANVIPDKGRVRMEFRSSEQAYFDEVVEKVNNCAKAAALATGCELEYHHFEPTCQGMKHNTVLAEQFREYMEEMGVQIEGEKFSGSTDMGNVSHVVPSIHPMFSITQGKEEIHTQEFLAATMKPFAQERMMIATKLLVLTGLKVLQDPAFLQKAKDEFNRK